MRDEETKPTEPQQPSGITRRVRVTGGEMESMLGYIENWTPPDKPDAVYAVHPNNVPRSFTYLIESWYIEYLDDYPDEEPKTEAQASKDRADLINTSDQLRTLRGQINTLTEYILEHHQKEIVGGGACETATRIMQKQRHDLAEHAAHVKRLGDFMRVNYPTYMDPFGKGDASDDGVCDAAINVMNKLDRNLSSQREQVDKLHGRLSSMEGERDYALDRLAATQKILENVASERDSLKRQMSSWSEKRKWEAAQRDAYNPLASQEERDKYMRNAWETAIRDAEDELQYRKAMETLKAHGYATSESLDAAVIDDAHKPTETHPTYHHADVTIRPQRWFAFDGRIFDYAGKHPLGTRWVERDMKAWAIQLGDGVKYRSVYRSEEDVIEHYALREATVASARDPYRTITIQTCGFELLDHRAIMAAVMLAMGKADKREEANEEQVKQLDLRLGLDTGTTSEEIRATLNNVDIGKLKSFTYEPSEHERTRRTTKTKGLLMNMLGTNWMTTVCGVAPLLLYIAIMGLQGREIDGAILLPLIGVAGVGATARDVNKTSEESGATNHEEGKS